MAKDRIQSRDSAKADASKPVELTDAEVENVQGGVAPRRKATRSADASKGAPKDDYDRAAKGIIDSIGR